MDAALRLPKPAVLRAGKIVPPRTSQCAAPDADLQLKIHPACTIVLNPGCPFSPLVDTCKLPPGLDPDVIRMINIRFKLYYHGAASFAAGPPIIYAVLVIIKRSMMAFNTPPARRIFSMIASIGELFAPFSMAGADIGLAARSNVASSRIQRRFVPGWEPICRIRYFAVPRSISFSHQTPGKILAQSTVAAISSTETGKAAPPVSR